MIAKTSGSLLFQLKSWARFIFPSSYLAPYHPTPAAVATKMLKLARVDSSDVVCDIGCGNGSLLLSAWREFKARGIGYELDGALVAEARSSIQKAGFEPWIQIHHEDARLATDIEKGTVILLYLSEKGNKVLIEKLRPRISAEARVVSFAFPILGYEPTKEEKAHGISIFLFENLGSQDI